MLGSSQPLNQLSTEERGGTPGHPAWAPKGLLKKWEEPSSVCWSVCLGHDVQA